MRILFLCSKKIYTSKMSRVRFHGIGAIGRHPDVILKIDGPGWDGFMDAEISEQKFKPDLVIWYKPLDIPGYDKVKTPKCIRYNEMWDPRWTEKEIVESRSELVICHHFNDIPRYVDILDPKQYKLVHNPHCGETNIFKDYNQEKTVDVLLVGVLSKNVYPLRERAYNKIAKHIRSNGFTFQRHKHPGYKLKGLESINKQVKEYAKAINRAKIVITDASTYKYALAKYVEIPLCNTAIAGNIPHENQAWFRKFLIELNNDKPAKNLADKVCAYLTSGEWKKLAKIGHNENLKYRTQEDYARRFINIANDYLSGKMEGYYFRKDSGKYLNGGDGKHG